VGLQACPRPERLDEAVPRVFGATDVPNLPRFVPTKTPEQRVGLMLHRARHLFIRQQTAVINAIRAHLGEFGDCRPGRTAMVSRNFLESSPIQVDKRVPEIVRACLAPALGAQLRRLKEQDFRVRPHDQSLAPIQ